MTPLSLVYDFKTNFKEELKEIELLTNKCRYWCPNKLQFPPNSNKF